MSSVPASSNTASGRGVYTVSVRGERFVLSFSQINFDSPNHFTDAFLGDFAEATSREMHLDSNPELFAIIVDYLSGYDVLPLEAAALPRTMGVEKSMRNLARDAEYLGLNGLSAQLASVSKINYPLSLDDLSLRLVKLEDVIEDRLPPSVSWGAGGTGGLITDDGKQVLVRVTDACVQFGPGSELNTCSPSSHTLPTWANAHDYSCAMIYRQDASWPDMFGTPKTHAIMFVDELPTVSMLGIAYYRQSERIETYRLVQDRVLGVNLWAMEAVFTISGKEIKTCAKRVDHTYWHVNLVSLRAQTSSYISQKLSCTRPIN